MTMKAHIDRWGDSLAVRLPKEFVDRLGLAEGGVVSLSADRDGVTIERERTDGEDELRHSLADIDKSIEQLRRGEGRPMRQAIAEMVDRFKKADG